MSLVVAAVSRVLTPAVRNSFRSFSSKISGSNPVVPAVSMRLEALRAKLKIDEEGLIDRPLEVFEISERGKAFLEDVNSYGLNKKYSRGGANGEGFVGLKEVVNMMSDRYDLAQSQALMNVSKQIEDRMRVKVSRSYIDHAFNVPEGAKEPNPILRVVMPDVEIVDLTGETDPSNQNRYSPVPGLLHKYEMLLAFVAINCSSHCRYCYRLDLFNGSSNKSKADMNVIAAYIKTFNGLIRDARKHNGVRNEAGVWIDRESNDVLMPIDEILFSGGDPMTLPNATLARYMTLVAEAGVKRVRLGTKELVFNPQRFDNAFWKMMDLFHQTYPEITMEIMGHYVHPYELVEPKLDEEGKYLYDSTSRYRVREDIIQPLSEINKRSDWIAHRNQFPIIAGINDSAEVLRLLMMQTERLRIFGHNVYVCREIRGSAHFRGENTIERQYQLFEEAKDGLPGLEAHNWRLIMSTEYGKMQVSEVNKDEVRLKMVRFVNVRRPENTTIKIDLSKLPSGHKLYWLTEDVIESAVSEEGKRNLKMVVEQDASLITQFKKLAAQKVRQQSPNNDNQPRFERKNYVTIEVKTRNGSRFIEVNLNDRKDKELTLAGALAEKNFVEAACKEKLSCSTCVGEVESDGALPKPSEDELDLVDAVTPKGSVRPEVVENLRAGCQIPLKSGQSYKFTNLSDVIRRDR